jgi:hypothetical protein
MFLEWKPGSYTQKFIDVICNIYGLKKNLQEFPTNVE